MIDDHSGCENCKEDVKDIRELVERLAKRQGFGTPRCTGFIFALEFLDDNGDHKWAFRRDPEQGFDTDLRMGKLVELETNHNAERLFGMRDCDG